MIPKALLLSVLSISIAGCGEEKPNTRFLLKEVIDVEGTCWEDHVGQHDSYGGQIVRWQSTETGKISTYGFLAKRGDFAQHILDEVTHPTVYHTPMRLAFLEISIDTNQPKWVLHGLSDRGAEGEPIKGYNSTCNIEVVKRGMEIRVPGAAQNAR
jgi:hypothetical protein